jgi:predicted RNase H-like nuclease (RuvC/YqgF family)
MSIVKKTDINNLLESWSNAKAEITKLEKKIEKYKRLANIIMDGQSENSVSSESFTLKRKELSRNTISKKDVPKDIWDKYSNTSSFSCYYLSANN